MASSTAARIACLVSLLGIACSSSNGGSGGSTASGGGTTSPADGSGSGGEPPNSGTAATGNPPVPVRPPPDEPPDEPANGGSAANPPTVPNPPDEPPDDPPDNPPPPANAMGALAIVGSKAVLYLNSDLGVTDGGNGLASGWADQTANDNDLTQSETPRRVSIVRGTDGHQALQGDGTEKWLERVDRFRGLDTGDHPVVYVVAEFLGVDTVVSILFEATHDRTAGPGIAAYHTPEGTYTGRALLQGASFSAQADWGDHVTPTPISLYKVQVTDAGSASGTQISVNGRMVAGSYPEMNGDGLQHTLDDFRVMALHGGEFFEGRAYLYLVLDRALTASEEQALMAWFDEQYPSIGL